jgi:hypothetical protein
MYRIHSEKYVAWIEKTIAPSREGRKHVCDVYLKIDEWMARF